MPLFLWFYLAGLTLALGVGLVFYSVAGGGLTHLWQTILGERPGAVFGRACRLMLVITALMGGLATQWYGCGYADYERVASDRRAMTEKMTDQISQATAYSNRFLVGTAALAAILYALLPPRPKVTK